MNFESFFSIHFSFDVHFLYSIYDFISDPIAIAKEPFPIRKRHRNISVLMFHFMMVMKNYIWYCIHYCYNSFGMFSSRVLNNWKLQLFLFSTYFLNCNCCLNTVRLIGFSFGLVLVILVSHLIIIYPCIYLFIISV